MAGGQGVRLRPLTCSVPKPLSLLCGRPVVYYILDLLNEHGFDEAIFTLGYKAGQIERLFETGRYKNINLRFSREDSPLGTAGCVKRAFGMLNPPDGRLAVASSADFLVISGDALCDFDLSAVIDEHKKVKAQATIITKRVDDPREYGLVISEMPQNDGKPAAKVLGFSEKPSYLSCMGDCANTGVYVLSPSVMELIPDNAPCDFAREVFPKMLQNKMPLYSYEESGYWCDIGDFSTYAQSQFDILSGKVKCCIDKTKKHGNNHIGENVTIGKETVIDSCVIGDNVSIGSRAKLKNSIILDSAFISDGVTANGAIICKGAKLMHSAGVYEGSVIGEGCRIGREAIISDNVKIWNEKTIPHGANVTRDVKYGSKSCVELSDNRHSGNCVISGETNADITPELCARLGAALACTSATSCRIAVSCESNNASIAMKYAIMAGVSGGGGDVFDIGTAALPQLIYAAGLLDCGIIARVKCGIFAEIEILESGGLPLTRQNERRLEAAVSRSEYKNAAPNSFGLVQSVSVEALYTSMLYSHARFKSDYKIKLNCNNARLSRRLAPVFDSISSNSKNAEILVVALTQGGSKAEIYTENDTKIDYERLLLLGAARTMKNGNDVALPNDFAACADFLAAGYGRKVERYFLCSNDSGDERARGLAAKQIFLTDGAVLALNVLEELSQSGMSIEDAVKSVPQFVCARREVEINCPPQRIISRLCSSEAGCGKGEGVLVGNNRESVLIRSSKRGNSLFLFAESLSSETAAELCDNAEGLIKKIMGDV
jgi:mannose-1-phosphate guanylyltransferase/phosphomannomutase